jgi:hypothetical protein
MLILFDQGTPVAINGDLLQARPSIQIDQLRLH